MPFWPIAHKWQFWFSIAIGIVFYLAPEFMVFLPRPFWYFIAVLLFFYSLHIARKDFIQSRGGSGGKAEASGQGSNAVGGKGGMALNGGGGDGGDAIASGRNAIAKGGDGGHAL